MTHHHRSVCLIKVSQIQRSRSRSRSRHRHHETRAEDTPKSVKQIIFESRLNPLNQRALSRQYFEILRSRRSLPVFESLDVFEEAYKKNPVIIVEGETGSGKTTQIPQVGLLCDAYLLRRYCYTCWSPIWAMFPTSPVRSPVVWRRSVLQSEWRRKWMLLVEKRWVILCVSRRKPVQKQC